MTGLAVKEGSVVAERHLAIHGNASLPGHGIHASKPDGKEAVAPRSGILPTLASDLGVDDSSGSEMAEDIRVIIEADALMRELAVLNPHLPANPASSVEGLRQLQDLLQASVA